MKTFLALALVALLSLGARAQQQLTISASSSDGLVASSVGTLGTDNLVVGQVQSFAEYAFVGRYNDFGPVWTRAILDTIILGLPFLKNSSMKDEFTTSGGDIIVVGSYEDNALVARLDQDGNTLWAKIFVADAIEVFEGVTVDPLGVIYVVGTQTALDGLSSHEIYAALTSGGTFLAARQASPRVGGALHSAKAVFYIAGVLYVVGQTDYTGSIGGLSNTTVTMTRLDPLNFGVLGYQLMGTHSHEQLLDAKANSNGIFFVIKAQNDPTSRIIAWYRPAVFSVVATVIITGGPFNPSPDFGGTLTLDGQSLYLSGGAMESGVQKSYIMKVGMITSPVNDLVPVWGRMITPGTASNPSVATAVIAVGGEVTLVDASGGPTQSTITSIATSGAPLGFYCNPPTVFTPGWSTYNMSSGGMGLTLAPLAYSEATTSFRPYQTVPDPCATMLPVELYSFTGEKDGRTSVLHWRTATEHGVSHFNLRRSKDTIEWEEIGVEPAVGESQQITSYGYVDDDPHVGINYYQLEVVDLDGSTEFSDVVVVEHPMLDNVPLRVYPNPAVSGHGLTINVEFQEAQIFDPLGRLISTTRNGDPLVINGAQGVYPLVITRADGSFETIRVVLN